MAEEVSSLSLEETNNLRIKAGLNPIPVPDNENYNDKQLSTDDDDVISLSVQETNKLRTQIGLPLIPTDSFHKDTDVKNFENHQHEILNKQKNKELLERINEAKFKSNKRKFLKSDTLINSSNELDTDEWLLKLTNDVEDDESKPKKKPKIKKMKADDEVLAVIGHSAKELRSIGDNEILTLKDTDLLDDEDILTSESLSRQAKLKKDLAERRETESVNFNGRHYSNHHRDEDGDEEDDDKDLDDVLLVNEKVVINKNTVNLPQLQKPKPAKTGNVSEFSNLFEEINEVENIKPKPTIKMKKIKKRKPGKLSKPRKLGDVEPVQLISMDEDNDEDQVEEDIASDLSKFRAKKLQSQAIYTPEKLAEEIAANRRWEFERKLERESFARTVFDDTAGFLNNLENNILSDEEITKNKDEQQQEEEEIHGNEISQPNGKNHVDQNGSAPKFNGGLADALKFLKSKNIIQSQAASKVQELEREEASKKSELLKMKISIEVRILKEELSKDKEYIRMPKADKFTYFEKLLDSRLREKGIVIKDDDLKVYNPKVELTYKDDMGNTLDRKKAWKEFSHKYHGTGLDKHKKKKD